MSRPFRYHEIPQPVEPVFVRKTQMFIFLHAKELDYTIRDSNCQLPKGNQRPVQGTVHYSQTKSPKKSWLRCHNCYINLRPWRPWKLCLLEYGVTCNTSISPFSPGLSNPGCDGGGVGEDRLWPWLHLHLTLGALQSTLIYCRTTEVHRQICWKEVN